MTNMLWRMRAWGGPAAEWHGWRRCAFARNAPRSLQAASCSTKRQLGNEGARPRAEADQREIVQIDFAGALKGGAELSAKLGVHRKEPLLPAEIRNRSLPS